MGATLDDGLDEDLIGWIHAQPLFFVATAPASGGHVNVSPKGYDTLRVLGPHHVAYRDLTGSGAETAAHLRDDGRITLLWCAFDQPPRLVRVQGRGRLLLEGDDGYADLDAELPTRDGARAIVEVVADRVGTACGYSVPLMELVGERDTLARWAAAKDDDELDAYRRRKNARSIDGLPALPGTEQTGTP
jgi:predicted pyridoxine 5'-phosphate oxidase superfamily flavin-nucleotide-binding protein